MRPDVAEWVAKADSDRLNIRNNLASAEVPWDTVCYHAQQVAEKMLKGCLVSLNINPPKTHDLLRLITACEDGGAELDDLREDCSSLSQHAAQSRYPGAFSYRDRIGKEAADAAERVYSRLKTLLKAEAK